MIKYYEVGGSDHYESFWPEGKIIRLTNQDRVTLEVTCPYCGSPNIILAPTKNGRPVGTKPRCYSCDLVWRVSIHIKNHGLPDQQMEWRRMYKKGWRPTYV